MWIEPCDALEDDEPRGWLSVLDDPAGPGIDRVVAAVNPRIACRPVDPSAVSAGGARPVHAWELVLDPDAEPRKESRWARVARTTSVASFVFRPGGT